MRPGLIAILRSKGLAVAVHAAFWALLLLVIVHLQGKAPEYREVTAYSLPAYNPVPVDRLGSALAQPEKPGRLIDTNMPSPFFTAAFLPAPKPAPPPPPPPPTTKKVTLVYQGFFETAGKPRTAMIKAAEGLGATPLGGQVVTNHFAAEITMRALTITNTSGATNVLLLNTPAELEIPIK